MYKMAANEHNLVAMETWREHNLVAMEIWHKEHKRLQQLGDQRNVKNKQNGCHHQLND